MKKLGIKPPSQRGKSYPNRKAGSIENVHRGDSHPYWKGTQANHSTIHEWVRKWKGAADKCEVCGEKTDKRYEWSNVDHKYRRVLDDYIAMCMSCHNKYDLQHNNKKTRWTTNKWS